jgi:UDP-N-acetylglucosamine 1-carboxyvinyltransferase
MQKRQLLEDMVVGAIASQQSVTQHLNVKGGQRLQGTLTVSGAKN